MLRYKLKIISMKKNLILGIAISASVVCFLFAMRQAKNVKSDLITENVEALSQDDAGLDCNYVRKTASCTITVGAKGSVKLFSGSILNADADGKITIDGVVTCSRGGDSACKPVECVNLYKVL